MSDSKQQLVFNATSALASDNAGLSFSICTTSIPHTVAVVNMWQSHSRHIVPTIHTAILFCNEVVVQNAGTVTNVREASLWLSYTYLFVRMLRNPLAYGVGWEELTADPRLEGRR